MNKEDLLKQVADAAQSDLVSRRELLKAFERGRSESGKRMDLSKALYGLGGLIVFLGIAFLVFQNWDDLNSFTKILATLGAGALAYITGTILAYRKHNHLADAFHFIALMVIPIGIHVAFDLGGYDVDTSAMQSIISGILLVMALVSLFVFKRGVFGVFSVIYATWLFFAFTEYLPISGIWDEEWKFFSYRAMVAGLSYLLIGYYLSQKGEGTFSGGLYGFGLVAFLGSTLALGGWEPEQNIFWELAYPGITFAVIILSVYLKSRVFLVMGSMFLIFYIFKITSEYFEDSLGWPLSLILVGLALIGIGYGAVTVNRRYLK